MQAVMSSADSWDSFPEIISFSWIFVYTIHLHAYLDSNYEQGPHLYLLSCAHPLPSSSINV